MSARLPVRKTYKLFVGGTFPRSESGRTYEAEGANVARGSRKDARHFQEAGDRQALKVVNQGRAGAAEPLAAEAGNQGGRIESKEFASQRAGVEVPGRLTAGDHDAHGSGVAPRARANAAGGSRNRAYTGLVKRLAASGTLYSKVRTWRVSTGTPAACTTAANAT